MIMAYTEQERKEIINDICEKLIDGYSLRKALKELGTISAPCFFEWVEKYEEFAKQYARASNERAALIFEDIADIADDGTNDWMERHNEIGEVTGWAVNGEHIQRSKLRIDARKWQLSKMQPKKYGDKLDLTTDGEKMQTSTPLTPAQLVQQLKDLEASL